MKTNCNPITVASSTKNLLIYYCMDYHSESERSGVCLFLKFIHSSNNWLKWWCQSRDCIRMGIISQFKKYDANYMKLGRCPHIVYRTGLYVHLLQIQIYCCRAGMLMQLGIIFNCFLKYFHHEVIWITALKAIFYVTTIIWWSTFGRLTKLNFGFM
jgi:hypothetical protein